MFAEKLVCSWIGALGLAARQSFSEIRIRADRIAPALVGGFLFVVNHLFLIRAWLYPPPGTRPMFVERDVDIALHLTWMSALRDRWLIPDFHMAHATTAGLFSPLMLLLGRIAAMLGADVAFVYTATQLMMYVLGGYALYLCFRVFLTTQKQRYAASLCALCVYSIGDLERFVQYLASGVATTQTAMTVYERDGFIQPGPLTLTVGTVLVILAIGLIGFYVQNGSRLALIGASIVAALSALPHPFEVFGIIAGTSASLLVIRREWWRTAFLEIAVVAIPACLIILMYTWLSLRTDWTAELTTRNQFGLRGTATAVLSIPLIAAVALFVIGPRLKRTSDIVLKCWFGSILVTMVLPLIPFRLHLNDGLAVVMSLFLVRELAAFSFAPRTRQIALGFCAILLGVSVAIQGLNRYIMFDSGNQTSALSSAVAPDEESLSVNWLRAHGKPDDLVLAPALSAPWIATAPIHSYGSHWLASLFSPEETDVAQRFYAGKLSAEQSVEFLAKMGIKYVLVPVASPAARLLRKTNLAANVGTWMVYKFPDNQMSWYVRNPGHVNKSIAVRLGYARPK